MAGTHIRFSDEVEEYQPTDSEDEYNPREKELLKKARKRKAPASDSEDELYGVHSDSSSEIALSDVEGQDKDDDLPDVRAWGKDKRHFYSTDYVDPDYGGYQGKDAALADIEEEEARNLQKQLMEQLDDDDFSLDLIHKTVVAEDKKQVEEVVKTDVSKLSKRQKIDLLLKESPEFSGLVEDFKNKTELARDFLAPIIDLSKSNQVSSCEALNFVKTHYEIILNYCTNIAMYLLLKASRVNVQNHPVIKRLYQYRQLLAQLDPIFDTTIKPQVEVLIENSKNPGNAKTFLSKKKKLKILKKSLKNPESPALEEEPAKSSSKKLKKTDKEESHTPATDNQPVKSVRFNLEEKTNEEDIDEDSAKEETEMDNEQQNNAESRRAITYQIAKNKGLTPRRNKLQRNPRVKNRDKFRKAKIRRKGAVREVRTEMSRYAGELSGIKASVTKSVKIKS